MTTVFKCERCNNYYESNNNQKMQHHVKNPSLLFGSQKSIASIQLISPREEVCSEEINLCDACGIQLSNFLLNKEE